MEIFSHARYRHTSEQLEQTSHYMAELVQETGGKGKNSLGVLPRDHYNHEAVGGSIKRKNLERLFWG